MRHGASYRDNASELTTVQSIQNIEKDEWPDGNDSRTSLR